MSKTSIVDLRDLTSEQVNKIATAQAVEAAIFEYNYQFNLATQTQLSYHELIYTIIVTAVSTAITMGATLCVGKAVQLAGSLANTATKELSKSASKTLMSLLQPTAGFTASSVAYAVLKEIGQEVLIDPWIESAVSGMVRRAGGDAMLQMVLSSVAESLRETLTGPFTNLFSSQQSQQSSFMSNIESKYFSKGLKPTVQDVLTAFNEYKTEIKTQKEQRKEQMRLLGGATRVLSFVSIAIGFTASQFLGPVGALMYSTLITYCFSEDISLKDVFHKAFNPFIIAIDKVGKSIAGDYYRNHKKETLTLLGIGAWSIGLVGLRVILPSLNVIWDILSGAGLPITIGMVNIKQNENNLDNNRPYKISSKKKILISSWLEHITKGTRGYASIKLLSDLQIALQTQSQKLAKLFPDRVSRFKLSHLSLVSGISDNILRGSRSTRYTIEKSLNYINIIEKSLIKKYNKKEIDLSLTLIEKYRTGPQEKEFYKEVIDGICLNLGKISGLVRLNYHELSLVLKAKSETNSKTFVHDIIQWIIHKNNEYSLSLEEVEGYKEILKGWMLDDAKRSLDIINSYIKQNPNIDRWNKQYTRIPRDKIDYFGSLSTLPERFISGKVSKQEFKGFIAKMFFFGFLYADGWISGDRIGMELTWNDRAILYSFAKEVGLPESRVTDRERPMTYKGETKWYRMAGLRFGCKGMAKDLNKLGKFGSKSLMGQLPQVVKDLIKTSEEMELRGMKNSELPMLLAKAWLYGLYNGDGSLGLKEEDGWISPVIIAGNIEILEEIYEAFNLKITPRVAKKPGELVLMFDHDIISKGVYVLNLGAEYFRSLVKDLYGFTHTYDLKRKRAIPSGNGNFLGKL